MTEYLTLIVQSLILAVAFASVFIARNAIAAHRQTARQQATLQFIHQYNADERVSLGHQIILRHENESLDEYLKPGGENFNNFLFVMNMFEILAIGLKRGIYDKDMAIDMFGDDLRNIYKGAKKMIEYIRKTGEGAFRHLEELADSVETSHKIK